MWDKSNNSSNSGNENSINNNNNNVTGRVSNTLTGQVRDSRNACVKALHMRRDALKARIRQKHEKQRHAERESCIAQARHSGGNVTNTYSCNNNEKCTNSDNNSYTSSGNSSGNNVSQFCNDGSVFTPNALNVDNANCLTNAHNQETQQLYSTHYLESSNVTYSNNRLDILKWADVGREFGCDVNQIEVMQYLLELEDEIRQEELISMYEESNNVTNWEEYYNFLTSQS